MEIIFFTNIFLIIEFIYKGSKCVLFYILINFGYAINKDKKRFFYKCFFVFRD